MKVTVRFFRHGGICRPICSRFKSLDRSTAFRPGSAQTVKDAPEVLRPTHRRDEFRPAIPQRVARQQSPPPLHRHAHPKSVPGSATMNLQRTVNSVLTVCLSPRDHPTYSLLRTYVSRIRREKHPFPPVPRSRQSPLSPATAVGACRR